MINRYVSWPSVSFRATVARKPAVITITFPRPPLAGTVQISARLRATGISLCYEAGQAQSAVRLLGATLGGKLALAGSLRTAARLREANLILKVALTGTVQSAVRLPGAFLTLKVTLDGKVRTSVRLPGAFLGLKVVLAGVVRSAPRLTAATLTSLSRPDATPVRTAARLPSATLNSLTALTGQLRTAARLAGSNLTMKVALNGTLRTAARVQAASLGMRVVGALAGQLRMSARLRALSISLTYKAQPARSVPRLRGATLKSKTSIQGKLRTAGRLRPAILVINRLALGGKERTSGTRLRALSIRLVYKASPIRVLARTKGLPFVGPTTLLLSAGKIRVAARTQNATTLRTLLTPSKIRASVRLLGLGFVEAPRFIGAVRAMGRVRSARIGYVGKTLIEGTSTTSERLRGAVLRSRIQVSGGRLRTAARLQGLALSTRFPFTGAIRVAARAFAELDILYSTSPIRGTFAILRGIQLAMSFPYQGRVRAAVRLRGATIVMLGHQRLSATPIRATARLNGATYGYRLAIQGTTRSTVRLRGASTTLKSVLDAAPMRAAARLFGLLKLKYGASAIRSATRLTGASLSSALPLSGSIRSAARLHGVHQFTGGFTINVAGTLRAWARTTGSISLHTGAAPARAWARLPGAKLDVRIPLEAAYIRQGVRLQGTPPSVNFPALSAGGYIRTSGLARHATLVQRADLFSTAIRTAGRLMPGELREAGVGQYKLPIRVTLRVTETWRVDTKATEVLNKPLVATKEWKMGATILLAK